ncbi:unnamed protein product, partial [Vitis vinifera]
MDSSSEGIVYDPSKINKLSMEEKRELVYAVSKWSRGGPEMLQSWSRQEILQILCAEMGKERKYTGLTKLKIIEHLLRVRQRKADHPSRLPVAANNHSISNGDGDLGNAIYCKNLACRANLSREYEFCKRCSCCICHQYDDNKDPSLWLTCSSDPPFQGVSCGMSCHLECAFKHEKSGIAKDGRHVRLDGSFYCVSCGKVNDMLGCWRKQLMMAKETRRVDILCYRVSLSQKLLNGTKKYQKLYEIVEEAVKKLEAEVGPLTGLPVKTARGIVNRLSSGPEVQRLCALALESLDSVLSNSHPRPAPGPKIQDAGLVAPSIRFEDVCSTSLTVILGSEDSSTDNVISYKLWHRKSNDLEYPAEPACTMLAPNKRFTFSDLTPSTEYVFKVVSFQDTRELGMGEVQFSTSSSGDDIPKSLVAERSQSPATNCSSLSNPSSVEDETNNVTPYHDQNENREDNYPDSVFVSDDERDLRVVVSMPKVLKPDNKTSLECQIIEEMSTDKEANTPVRTGMECVPFVGSSEAGLPITPCKLEIFKDDEPQAGSSSKKRSAERQDEECAANGPSDRDFEYYVKVIRWLECEGHVEKNFRQKFLTWYSLRATPQEVRIVKVFVDTLIEDPASLAEQLIDTFSETISSKRSSVVPAGFCMKLWH